METKGGRALPRRSERAKGGRQLAALIKEHQEEIATAWAELVQGLPGYNDLPAQEVRSFASQGLAAIAECLETGSRTVLEEYVTGICPPGGEAVPDATAVTEALLLCKDAVLAVIRDALGFDSGRTWALVCELDACLRQMAGRLTSLLAAGMTRQLQAQQAQAAMFVDLAQVASSTLELDEVVSRVADGIAAALGADGCTFHLVDEEQRSALFLRWPSNWSSRVLRSFDSYASAFHEVLTTRQPLTSYDVQSDPRFLGGRVREVGYKSMLGVPLMVKGKVIAEAWAYTLSDNRHFTEEEIALAQGIANVLGLVIQSAQLYERSKRLAVMEERGRLAREIHDGVAQTLGALQLKASQLEESLANDRVTESLGYLSELQEMVSRAYRDLREAMLGLRSVVEPGAGLVAALREYLTHYREQYPLDVDLQASDDEPAVFDGETQAQAMRIVQEALSNVRRHSGTDKATLRIERRGDVLWICVGDEGRGFDLALAEGRELGRHLGLRIMRERAESVGGTLAVESRPGEGTTVELELPLYEDRGSE